MLDHAPAADVGYAAVPLGELHSIAALRRARGGRGRGAAQPPGRPESSPGRVEAARPRRRSTRSWRRGRGRARDRRTARPSPRCPHWPTTPAARRRGPRRDADPERARRSTTARSPTCRSRPRSTRPSNGSSTAPTPRACTARTRAASTSRSPCRPPTRVIDEPARVADRALRRRAGPAAARGGPGRGARRVRHPRAAGDLPAGGRQRAAAPVRRLGRRRASGWPGRGPPPAGPTRWRAPCAAAGRGRRGARRAVLGRAVE